MIRKFYLWGAGERGKRIFKHLGPEWVEAFVDRSVDKISQHMDGVPVISPEEYYKHKNEIPVIICSNLEEDDIEKELKQNGVWNYFRNSELPGAFVEPYSRPIYENYVKKIISSNITY